MKRFISFLTAVSCVLSGFNFWAFAETQPYVGDEDTSISLVDDEDTLSAASLSYWDTISGDWSYVTLDDGTLSITGYGGNATDVTVPDTLDGIKVTSVGWLAFDACSDIKTIRMGNNVTAIDMAFTDCTALENIYIPASLQNIDYRAFDECSSLKNIYFAGTKSQWDKFNDVFVKRSEEVVNAKVYCNGELYHEHSYGSGEITRNPTCVNAGEKRYKCSCGHVKIEVIPATGKHNYLATKVPATMTSKGYTSYTCSICGKSYIDADSYTDMLPIPKPSAITGFKLASRGAASLKLSWSKNNSVTGYQLEVYKGGKWVSYTVKGSGTTSYTITGLASATKYSLRIRGYRTEGSRTVYGAYKNGSANTAPANMTGFKLKSKTTSSLTLQWNKNTSASGYQLGIYKGGKWVTYTIKGNGTTSYTIKSLSSNTKYKVRVRAYKTSGSSTIYGAYKDGSAGTAAVVKKPSAMTGFKLSSRTGSSMKLSWNKNTSASGYQLGIYKGGKWVTYKISGNSTTSYNITGLAASTSYKLRIRAYSTNGITTLYGDYKNGSANTAPSDMSGFKLKSKTTSSLTLQWNKNTSATGYQLGIYKGGKWTTYTIKSNKTTTYTIKSLAAGTKYSVRVRAYKTSGKTTIYGVYKNGSATTTIATPAALSGLRITATDYEFVTLSWNKSTNAVAYDIEQLIDGVWFKLNASGIKDTKITVHNLLPGTTYKFRIVPYNSLGSVRANGTAAEITATTLADETAVNGFKGAHSFTTPEITGNKVGAGVTRYKGNNDEFFLNDTYDGTNPKIIVSAYYYVAKKMYTHEVHIYLNGRDNLLFVLPSGMVNDGDVSTDGYFDGQWGIRHKGDDYFKASDSKQVDTCYLKALHMDWTGQTPCLLYFAVRTHKANDEMDEHEWEGLISVYLRFNVNNPPTPICIKCLGNGRCDWCVNGWFGGKMCDYCHGTGLCDNCNGSGRPTKYLDFGYVDNVYLP